MVRITAAAKKHVSYLYVALFVQHKTTDNLNFSSHGTLNIKWGKKKCPTCENSLLSFCFENTSRVGLMKGTVICMSTFFVHSSSRLRYFSMQVVNASHRENTVLWIVNHYVDSIVIPHQIRKCVTNVFTDWLQNVFIPPTVLPYVRR